MLASIKEYNKLVEMYNNLAVNYKNLHKECDKLWIEVNDGEKVLAEWTQEDELQNQLHPG